MNSGERYFRLLFKLSSISDIARLSSTLAIGLNTRPVPLFYSKSGEKYLCVFVLSRFLASGKRDLFIFFAEHGYKLSKYIRYVDAPVEKLEFRENTKNPVGIYLPVIRATKMPSILNPEKKDLKLKSGLIMLKDDVEYVGNISIIALNLTDFFRFILERKETLGIAFMKEIDDDKALYFTLGDPMRIGENLYGRIYCSVGKKLKNPFVSISETNEIISHRGRKDPALMYATLISIVEMPSNFNLLFHEALRQEH